MRLLSDVSNKVRQWDNRSNQWFSKNFSILFFELILGVIFFFFINHMMDIFTITNSVKSTDIGERILLSQAGLMLLIVLLLIINSFFMLYMFSNMLRMRNVLKNLDYNMSRRRSDHRDED